MEPNQENKKNQETEKNMENYEKWHSAALRIYSEKISAIEISKILQTQPTNAHEKGTLVSPNNPNSFTRKQSIWLLDSRLDRSQPLELHILELIVFIEKNITAINLLSSNCEIDLFCGFSTSSQGSFYLDSNLLKRLTLVPLSLVFDIYAINDE